MRTNDGWTRKQSVVVLGVLVAAACATPTLDTVDSEVVPATGGVGGDAAGMTALGGSMDAMTGTGGTTGGGTSTGGTGDTGVGGTGVGGSAGTGGTGMAGTATASGAGKGAGGRGSGKGGGSAGMTAMSGKGGTSGKGGASDGTESGCAKLSVPMNGATDKAHFVISLRTAADLSDPGTTISLRAYVEAGIGGVIFTYAQDANGNFLGAKTKPLLADQSGWVTLAWDVGAEPTVAPALMKASVQRIGIEIKAAPSATWSNPTVVYVDSISVNTTPALSFPFGTMGTVSAAPNQTADVTGQVLWLNSGTQDTTATGSTLGWVATCP